MEPNTEGRELNPPRSNVLGVEDDPMLRQVMTIRFAGIHPQGGLFDRYEAVGTGEEALEILRKEGADFNVLITDRDLGKTDMDGMSLIKKIKENYPTILTVLLSSRTEDLDPQDSESPDVIINKSELSLKGAPEIAKKVKNALAYKVQQSQ